MTATLYNGRSDCRPFFYVLAMVLLLNGMGVSAHRGHGCWTEMTWAEDRFEIIHRMHLSDAIAVLQRIEPETPIDSVRGKAQLALYLERHFGIQVDGQPVTGLQTLGAEIDDDFLLVYQEWQTSKPAEQPLITNRALLDIEPSAQHFLRYDVGQEVLTEQLITP